MENFIFCAVFTWFVNNQMKARQMSPTIKYTRRSKHPNCQYDNKISKSKKLLEIILNNKLHMTHIMRIFIIERAGN